MESLRINPNHPKYADYVVARNLPAVKEFVRSANRTCPMEECTIAGYEAKASCCKSCTIEDMISEYILDGRDISLLDNKDFLEELYREYLQIAYNYNQELQKLWKPAPRFVKKNRVSGWLSWFKCCG